MLKMASRSGSWVLRRVFLAALIALPLTAGLSQVQENGGLSHPLPDGSGLPPLSPLIDRHPDRNRILEDAMKMQGNEKRFAKLNVQRQKEMTSDTEKLVALANQVKAKMDKSAQDALSMESVRQVEQIEKLAHSVRDKMRASVSD
jgi:hypothetical protein